MKIILVKPLITEKNTSTQESLNQYAFEVGIDPIRLFERFQAFKLEHVKCAARRRLGMCDLFRFRPVISVDVIASSCMGRYRVEDRSKFIDTFRCVAH